MSATYKQEGPPLLIPNSCRYSDSEIKMNRIFHKKTVNKSLVKIEIVVKKINGVTFNNPTEILKSIFYKKILENPSHPHFLQKLPPCNL